MITREFFIANSDEYGFDSFDEKPIEDYFKEKDGTIYSDGLYVPIQSRISVRLRIGKQRMAGQCL